MCQFGRIRRGGVKFAHQIIDFPLSDLKIFVYGNTRAETPKLYPIVIIVIHPRGGENHQNAKLRWALGDKVTTMIKCVNGESVVLHHDTNLPRPYSLGFRVQGTKGIWMDVNKSLLTEGLPPDHKWTPAQEYLDKYDHPAWQKNADKAVGAGHGGMDWFLVDDFVECVKAGKKATIDVYDAAAWLAVTTLSETSIAQGSAAVRFPDFTRGRWIG